MLQNNIIFLGDWITDVYIDNINISQNQEIINCKSFKGYFNNLNLYPGGTGFVLENFLKQIKMEENNANIIFLLLDSKYIDYNSLLIGFNLYELFDRCIKLFYNNLYYNFSIMKMAPLYIEDVVKPTIKFRFFSKEKKEIYFRFDCDNDINIKYLNCNLLFKKRNDLILVDYDKGCFTEKSIINLTNDVINNNYNINTLFLNTKPHKIQYYERLIYHLQKNLNTDVIIQLNEKEYLPVKDFIHNYFYTNLIVTRGTKNILLFNKDYKNIKAEEINISNTIIDNVYTTSGCGDIFLSQIIYYYLYIKRDINLAIEYSINNMNKKIIDLNNKIFN